MKKKRIPKGKYCNNDSTYCPFVDLNEQLCIEFDELLEIKDKDNPNNAIRAHSWRVRCKACLEKYPNGARVEIRIIKGE